MRGTIQSGLIVCTSPQALEIWYFPNLLKPNVPSIYQLELPASSWHLARGLSYFTFVLAYHDKAWIWYQITTINSPTRDLYMLTF